MNDVFKAIMFFDINTVY